MTKSREIRSFDYVNFPYDRVRAALTGGALDVFRSATRAASSRAQSVASALRVEVAGIEIGKEISIAVNDITEREASATSSPVTRLKLEWEAASSPRLFPMMRAELDIYPLTATETQLDFSGSYEPPLGWLGSAVDAVVGHKIAEASVHRFVSELAQYLRKALS
jgi:hypothetical protein